MKKISINRQLLISHLKNGVTSVIKPNQLVPALSCFFFEKKGKDVTIKCANNEMEMVSTFTHEEGDDMTLSIEGDIFFSTLNSLKSDTVEMIVKDDQEFILKADKKKYSIPAYFSDVFPNISINPEKIKGIYIPAETLCLSINKALVAIDKKAMIDAYKCVRVNVEDNVISVTGSSSNMFYLCKFNHQAEDTTVYLIPGVAETLVAMQPKETLFLGTDGKKTIVKIGNITINAVSIEGKYPNIKPLFTVERKTSIIFNRNDIVDSVKRMRVYTGVHNDLYFSASEDGEYKIFCQNLEFNKKASEVVDVKTEGEIGLYGINMKFLLSAFSNIDSEFIKVSVGDKKNIPFLIEPLTEGSINESFVIGQYVPPTHVQS